MQFVHMPLFNELNNLSELMSPTCVARRLHGCLLKCFLYDVSRSDRISWLNWRPHPLIMQQRGSEVELVLTFGASQGFVVGSGVGAGFGPGVGMGVGPGVWSGVGHEDGTVGVGRSVPLFGAGTGIVVGTGVGICVGSGAGRGVPLFGVGAGIVVGTGVGTDVGCGYRGTSGNEPKTGCVPIVGCGVLYSCSVTFISGWFFKVTFRIASLSASCNFISNSLSTSRLTCWLTTSCCNHTTVVCPSHSLVNSLNGWMLIGGSNSG